MARVFDAFDERLERPVAVKLLRPETEALPGMRKRFQQEARLASRLIHPNIVGRRSPRRDVRRPSRRGNM
jgi:eukaryotic-like serine/threonine-protein kinase